MRYALCLLLIASPVYADNGALGGESARAASLAGSVVARPGDTSAIWFNPAGIADVTRPTLLLLGHAGARELTFARTGEDPSTSTRVVGGYGLSVVAALPGPELISRLRIGASVQIPAANVIRVVAPVRVDAPVDVWYGDRLERTAVTAALGYELPYGIRIGVGVSVLPTLFAPTYVGYDASRGDEVDEGVIVTQDRDLTLNPSFNVGARWQVIDSLAFGLVWRQGGATRAHGDFEIVAGAIEVIDRYEFYDFASPEEVALAVAVTPFPELALSLDLTWARWSDYRTIHDQSPRPNFNDVLDVRVGAELSANHGVRLRAGYAFLPSPVREQVAVHNFLDAHRHELAFGIGIDLEETAHVPVRFDVAFRYHVQHDQSATKNIDRLPDADREEPGLRIDNLGYPGFTSRGSYSQLSLSVTFSLDGQWGER
jgi:long-chain fatty acid transport protein